MAAQSVQPLDRDAIMKLVQDADVSFRRRADLPFGQTDDAPDFVARPANGAPSVQEPTTAPDPAPAPPVDAETAPEPMPEAAAPQAEAEAFSPAPPPEEIDLEAIRLAGIEEGRAAMQAEMEAAIEAARAEGHAAGRTEAEENLADARLAFLSAINGLQAQTDDVMVGLRAQLTDAVQQLAAQRAGAAIDAMPLQFRVRIDNLARSLSHAVGDTRLRLHPEDLAAIKPHLDGSDLLSGARIRPDDSLSRGDIVLRVGDIAMEDIMRPIKPEAKA
ncbi:FliH/SctL family protein [Pseudoprimorskyibacter insulae]|uniref:Flagellar assembly protein FliH n=1 Tax=Pseudoprimorskyibacter insulae TaxID=1695997 RepID=A0A2R8AVL7_9RHOB|nr:FliH/SctL family protein [Pseudoprimorskyibacter insulae]SPF80082.1 hypothetical protein PRI8871_01884 [Pseudoprimorskyibacter insulae]